jgi:hypothetical protein
MSEQTPPRRNKVSEEKARLRADVAAAANKVPEFVSAGGVQTTRRWVADNERAQRVAAGGLTRLSRKKLDALLKRLRGEVEAA